MTRLKTVGFELSSSAEFDLYIPTNGGNTWIAGRIAGLAFRQQPGTSDGYHGHFFPPTNEIYVRFGWRISSANLYDRIYIRNANDENLLRIQTGAGAVTTTVFSSNGTLGTFSNFIGGSVWALIEIHFKLDSTNGIVTIRADGVEVFNFTGNTNPQSLANPARILFRIAGQTGLHDVDDLGINDTNGSVNNSWLGDGVVLQLLPNGNGDSSGWTGSDGNQVDNYLLVDDNPNNGDTDYVSAASSGLKDLYQLANLTTTVPTNAAITVVQPLAIARRTDAGQVTALEVGVKSGATEDFTSPQDLTTTFQLYRGSIYEENPDTSSAWTKTELNDLQVGIRSA